MNPKARGTGRVFPRKGSSFFWCAYYLRGKEFRESTGGTVAGKAEKFLKRRIQEVGADQIGAKPFVGPQQERLKISCGITAQDQRKPDCDCLCCALDRDFRLRVKTSAENLSNLKRVRMDFALLRATGLSSEQVDRYIEQRRPEGAAPASINRVTQLLGQAFKLAIKHRRLTDVPYIRHLSEAGNVRQGFFSQTEFRAVVDNLPDYLKDFARFAYCSGMRKPRLSRCDGKILRGT
jgi:hypothetical protein